MSGVYIRVEDGGVLAALEHLVAATGDVKPALRSIGEYLMVSEEQRFRDQTSPEGQSWAPLSAGWEAWKAKQGRNPDKVLTYYGHLRESMRYQLDGDVLLFGTDVRYAKIHQFGGTIHHGSRSQTLLRGAKGSKFISEKSAKRRTSFTFEEAEVGAHDQEMPARPFLGLSDEDSVRVLEKIGEHLMGGAP